MIRARLMPKPRMMMAIAKNPEFSGQRKNEEIRMRRKIRDTAW